MNDRTINRLITLASYLEANGHSGSAIEIRKIAQTTMLGVDGPLFPASYNQRLNESDKTPLTDAVTIDNAQIALDITGLLPGIGEPADIVNAIIYTVRKKYFEAALSVLAIVPFVGIGATLVKRFKNAPEAIEALGDAARASGVSIEKLEGAADAAYGQFVEALNKLEKSIPDEYARNISPDALDAVKAQIDEIVEGVGAYISNASSSVKSLSEEATKALSSVRGSWEKLTPEFIDKLKESIPVVARKALIRSPELGPQVSNKIRHLFPDLSDEAYSTIEKEVSSNISRISIGYVDNIDNALRLYGDAGDGIATSMGTYYPKSNKVMLNLPALVNNNSSEHLLTAIHNTVYHEIGHNLDEIIGAAYHKVKNIGRFDSGKARTRYLSESIPDRPRKPDDSLFPDDSPEAREYFDKNIIPDRSWSGIKGVPAADAIHKAVNKGVLKGDVYLEEFGEIATRLRSIKSATRNNGALELFNHLKKDRSFFGKPETKRLGDHLLRANDGSPDGSPADLLMAFVWLQQFPDKFKLAKRVVDHGTDLAQIAGMVERFDAEAINGLRKLLDAV